MTTITRFNRLIENPNGNFHHVYNLIKRKWLKQREGLKKIERVGFDKEFRHVLGIRQSGLTWRKSEFAQYPLAADEYIALSKHFGIPIETLVCAHLQGN